MRLLLFILVGLGTFFPAFAHQNSGNLTPIYLVRHNMVVSFERGVVSLSLGDTYFVENVQIKAQSANRWDSQGQVMANGKIKGTVFVPGVDPDYTVTVRENTSTIEFRTDKNSVRYLQVIAYVRPIDRPQYHRDYGHAYNSQIARFSNHVLKLVDALIPHSHPQDQIDYLMPLRKVAIQALAIAEARGDASGSARPYFYALLETLDAIEPFLDDKAEITAVYELVLAVKMDREKFDGASTKDFTSHAAPEITSGAAEFAHIYYSIDSFALVRINRISYLGISDESKRTVV